MAIKKTPMIPKDIGGGLEKKGGIPLGPRQPLPPIQKKKS
jgi:hypothetical protein